MNPKFGIIILMLFMNPNFYLSGLLFV